MSTTCVALPLEEVWVRCVPAVPGVVLFLDAAGDVVLVDRSHVDVRARLRRHLAGMARPRPVGAVAFWVMRSRMVEADRDALVAAYERRHGRVPRCQDL